MGGFLALRQGDINLGLGMILTGSTNTIVNGRLAARQGDICTPHPFMGIPPKPVHPPNPLLIGSLKVIVNGRMYGHQMNFELLRHPYITGSTNTIIGF